MKPRKPNRSRGRNVYLTCNACGITPPQMANAHVDSDDCVRDLLAERKKALHALRTVLKRRRSDEQGGYMGRRDGRWDFTASSLTVKAEELDALFEFAGITPDEIQPLGDCNRCIHAIFGVFQERAFERGYDDPCGSCLRPKMSNFVPVTSLTRRQLRLSSTQRHILANIKAGRWWGSGFGPFGARPADNRLQRSYRSLLTGGFIHHGDTVRLTVKGREALRRSKP